MSHSSSQPLSVINVVTAGFQLYRNRFKPYFLLALKAYFWLLVPVYGWAKFCAISALISRLVYKELVAQPETIKDGTRYINSKMWQFFLAGIRLVLMTLLSALPIGILIAIVVGIIFLVFLLSVAGDYVKLPLLTIVEGMIIFTLFIILAIAFVIAAIAFIIRVLALFMRFFVFELSLAVEDNIDATSTIGRSRDLTNNLEGRILLIYFVAFLITSPLVALVQFVSSKFQALLVSLTEQNSVSSLLYLIFTLGLVFASGAIQLPFLQAVKAVVYYDLRTRKEGLGLKLRDRNI